MPSEGSYLDAGEKLTQEGREWNSAASGRNRLQSNPAAPTCREAWPRVSPPPPSPPPEPPPPCGGGGRISPWGVAGAEAV